MGENKRFIVIVGPSGVGKGALMHGVAAREPKLKFLTTCVTREPRPGERAGIDYHFLDKKTFEEGIAAGAFLEHDAHYAHYYGTRKSDVEAIFAEGFDALTDLNWPGVAQIEATMPVVKILVIPPSYAALEARLTQRSAAGGKPLSPERMGKIKDDMAHIEARDADYVFTNPDMVGSTLRDYDHVIVNDDLDTAVAEMYAAVQAPQAA